MKDYLENMYFDDPVSSANIFSIRTLISSGTKTNTRRTCLVLLPRTSTTIILAIKKDACRKIKEREYYNTSLIQCKQFHAIEIGLQEDIILSLPLS